MNSSPPESPDPIDELASLWAVRLEDGDLNEIQCAELDSWLVADPRHHSALAEYCQLSAQLEAQLPRFTASTSTVPAPLIRPRPRWWLPVGIAVAAAACFAVVLTWQTSPSSSIERVSTSIAQRQSVTLSDGTIVDLNAHTSLFVDHTPRERRVRLAGGQAFFQVTSDTSRPFIVDTPSGSIRVTGTAFDVRQTTNEQIEVTVQEGSVQVRLGSRDHPQASAPFSLTAGDQLSNTAGPPRLHKLSPAALADSLAWRDGDIVFEMTPLHEAVARFAQYHGKGITTSPAVASLEISGRFNLDDLDEFLSGLESILPVRVNQDLSGTIRVEARS